MPPRRILIFFSDTGGGHRAAAQALRDAFQARFADAYDVRLADGILKGARWPLSLAPQAYLPTTNETPWAYGAAFHFTNTRWGRARAATIIDRGTRSGIRRILLEQEPDLVLTVHPLLTRTPYRLFKALGAQQQRPAPFVTVVTDLFDAHGLWFSAPADLCVVPTEGARQRALSWDFPADRIRVVGLPVSLKFSSLYQTHESVSEIRARLGLASGLFTVLLIGGGEGMGPIAEITRALAEIKMPFQLAVITGRNSVLRDDLTREFAANPPAQAQVRVEGFVTNMPDWMRASDLVITKAGPGTIMEALAAGRPLLLSGNLPGQEEGNVSFVVENKAGVFRDTPESIASQVRAWLQPGSPALAHLRANASELARPDAALEIADLVDDLMKGEKI